MQVDRILNDSSGDIDKLLKMGITEFAIITYVVRVQEGLRKEKAPNALLEGKPGLWRKYGAPDAARHATDILP